MGLVKKANTIILLVGLGKVSGGLYQVLGRLRSGKKDEDLKKNVEKYATLDKNGNKPWAVITGASEGIGAGYALELAKTKMFNIALVSRSNEKMQIVKDEISRLDSSIEVKKIAMDLSSCGLEGYQSIFDETLKDKKVTILVNNAGKLDMLKIFD